VVCKKSGLARLSEGIGAGAASCSACACCLRDGGQQGSGLQGGTRARVGRESPVTSDLLTGQLTPLPRESLEGKKIKCVAFMYIISLLVFIQYG